MQTLLLVLCKIIATVLLADFVAGFVHWVEDAYAREDTPILGPLVARANIVHHHYPRYFTRLSWWQSSWDLLCISTLLVLGAWYLGVLTWPVWLFVIISTNANEIHKWEHRTRQENGPVISWLQDHHILQSPRHHAIHHTNPKNVHYCTTTNLLNPVLDRLHFWDSLEWLLAHTLNIHRRPDTSVPGSGPAPAWLEAYRRPAAPAKHDCKNCPHAAQGKCPRARQNITNTPNLAFANHPPSTRTLSTKTPSCLC